MARKPNLVFILSDQQSRDMIGADGVGSVRTPHIDDLAGDGVLVDHAISNSRCVPQRAACAFLASTAEDY